MDDPDLIELGDTVEIYLMPDGSEVLLNAVVLGTPCCEGDAWRVRTNAGKLVYVQHYATMTLISKGARSDT